LEVNASGGPCERGVFVADGTDVPPAILRGR